MYKALSKIKTIDDLHETTYARKKEERQLFVDQVKRIAENEGLMNKVIENVDTDFFRMLFEFLLSDKQEHIDRLFNFKINIFEQDMIKNSKNEEAKTAIRKSKTPLEALKHYITIWQESN